MNNTYVTSNTFTSIFAQGAAWTFNSGSNQNVAWGININDLLTLSADEKIAFVIESAGSTGSSSQIGIGVQNNRAPFTVYLQYVGSVNTV